MHIYSVFVWRRGRGEEIVSGPQLQEAMLLANRHPSKLVDHFLMRVQQRAHDVTCIFSQRMQSHRLDHDSVLVSVLISGNQSGVIANEKESVGGKGRGDEERREDLTPYSSPPPPVPATDTPHSNHCHLSSPAGFSVR